MRARGCWSGDALTPWQYAFLLFHQDHDAVDEALAKQATERRLGNLASAIAKAIRSADADQTNQVFEKVDAWLAGKPLDADEDPVMLFRNSDPLFGYDALLEQTGGIPDADTLREMDM